jgi:SAM-dependent methyltransferase
VSDCPGFQADLARSARLLRAFRSEQADPSGYYTVLAQDTISQLSQYTYLNGQVVADVGGGPGFFVRELRAAGARAFCVDTDVGELAAQGQPELGSIIGSALHLPLGAGLVDVCFSSNVLEHVPHPVTMADEIVRVTRPGGLVYLSYTSWLSPWGGHETSPWHYLGGHRAARRYERRYGRPPKNVYGESMFAVSVSRMLGWARRHPDADLLDALPRYHPRWARHVVLLPGIREVVTWNLLLVLRRR